MLLMSSADFFKINVFKRIFQENLHSKNCLDLDQDRPPVGPGMSPNCLQRLSSDGKEIVE